MMETITYFWLNYYDKDYYLERIPLDHCFVWPETDKLRLFLILDSTLICDNEYLESLENTAELIVYT